MKKILILILLLSCGCSAENLLKRGKKLILMAEAKGAKWERDTVKIVVEKITPEVKTDTVFKEKEVGDTVYVYKDKLRIKYVRLPGDSVFIEGKCLPDTVKIEVPVAINNGISAGYSDWEVISLVVVLLLIFLGILYLTRRRRNTPAQSQ